MSSTQCLTAKDLWTYSICLCICPCVTSKSLLIFFSFLLFEVAIFVFPFVRNAHFESKSKYGNYLSAFHLWTPAISWNYTTYCWNTFLSFFRLIGSNNCFWLQISIQKQIVSNAFCKLSLEESCLKCAGWHIPAGK